MTAADWISSHDELGMDHLQELTVLRAGKLTDPYSDTEIDEDWSNPATHTIYGYISSGSSSDSSSEVRQQSASSSQLVIPDPHADIKRRDRITQGTRIWVVTGFPQSDINPFVCWQPTLVANLEEVVG